MRNVPFHFCHLWAVNLHHLSKAMCVCVCVTQWLMLNDNRHRVTHFRGVQLVIVVQHNSCSCSTFQSRSKCHYWWREKYYNIRLEYRPKWCFYSFIKTVIEHAPWVLCEMIFQIKVHFKYYLGYFRLQSHNWMLFAHRP